MAKLLNDDREKPIYSSTRFSDVLIYAEVKDFLRVLFDDEKKLFIYCDGWDYIHIFLGKAALDYGLYPQDMSSKLSKNLGLFEFAISKNYQERLLNQDSYSKVTEYNGFYIYTREGSELLKNSVFRDIVKPYKKSKEITIEERIKKLEKKLDESVKLVNKDSADTKLVTSAYELNEMIKNDTEKRIVYDKQKNWFLVGNAENSIHVELLNDALIDGVYPPFEWNDHFLDGNGGDGIDDDGATLYHINPDRFVLFRTSSDPNNLIDYRFDNYTNCYSYKDYYVYDRKGNFKETPLYHLLGQPEAVEQLTESILDAKSVGDELMNIILKNPTRKELSDNDMNICRGAMGRSGNFYFISLSQLAHCDLFDTLEKLGIDDAPYNTFKYSNKTNTFYYYDPDNDLDFNLIKKELETSPYFKNFTGCKFDTFDDTEFDPELYEAVIPEQVPEKLYHATFSKLLRKIKKCGYLGNSPYKLWSDSNNKYVYLATDPDEAYSYAETALDDCDNERLYDMLEDDDIIILEIDTKYLDKNKLFKDENVVDGETTYQYEGIINCQIMKIYKPTLDESIVYGEMNDDEMMVILHNPTRKELKDNNLDDECRIIRDGNGGYYFASSEWTHEQIENKLKSKNLPYEETMGEFYYYQDNLFATRDDWNTDEEYNEYKQDWYETLKSSSYIVKTFGNFNVEIFGNEKLNESINLHKNNRVAGFFYYKDNKWELLPRTEEILDMDDDWDKYLKFQHNAPEGWLEEVGAIRFSIETHDDNKTLCVIESPKESWIKPFIKRLYNKFPEEMSMVDIFDVEYQDIYDQTHWKQFSPLDLD